MIATTIDEVIKRLEEIIQTSTGEESALGYFAALYQKVTIKVKDKLGTGYFEDDERMAQLDIVFANRYLDAYSNYKAGNNISKSWARAFDAGSNNDFIVLQHLLLGMNAHINLDLGIAAVQISTKESIADLQSDFNKINEILSSLVAEIQQDLCEIWPKLLWILKHLDRFDDFLIDFSMSIARDGAWKFANEVVAVSDEKESEALIALRDAKIELIANKVTNHKFLIRILFKIIRFGERGTVVDKIEALSFSDLD